MGIITSSVGRGGVNQPEDVRIVQDLLNKNPNPPKPALGVDGKMGPKTVAAIEAFQKNVLNVKNPDGRVDPGGKTLSALAKGASAAAPTAPSVAKAPTAKLATAPAPVPENTRGLPPVRGGVRLVAADFDRAAKALKCEVACIKAVTEVEAKGGGFYPSGRPKILFEAHIFSRRTQRKYETTNPDISSLKWNRKLYKRGEQEYERLEKAMSLNHEAALESASWGLFQIMGFNFEKAGFNSVDAYVDAMFESEGRQLDAFISFLQASKLDSHLRDKRWADFAKGYNGPGYAENQYDRKLEAAYEKFRRQTDA